MNRGQMSAILFESVQKVFRRPGLRLFRRDAIETHAVRDLSLSVSQGEVLALLGPNGSGKSTTLRLISTVLLPDEGRVLVHGIDTRRDSRWVRRHVGFALASERSFFPRLTARENLEFFATLDDVPRQSRRSRVDAVLDQVGLLAEAGKLAMKLSSGMQQRLGIARALLKNPRVLLLDEPTRSLDPLAAANLWELVTLLADSGITLVLATHNFREAASVANRAAFLQNGILRDIVPVRSEHNLRAHYAAITGTVETRDWQQEVPA